MAISIRREKVPPPSLSGQPFINAVSTPSTASSSNFSSMENNSSGNSNNSSLSAPPTTTAAVPPAPASTDKDQFMYRLLVRTNELLPLRGCVLEDSIPALKSEKIKNTPTKEVLEFACPELNLSR